MNKAENAGKNGRAADLVIRMTAAYTMENPEFQVRSAVFLNHREKMTPDIKAPEGTYEEDWV